MPNPFFFARRLVGKTKQKIQARFALDNPDFLRLFTNCYPPYVGAGVRVEEVNFEQGRARVAMPLRWYNKNIMGVQFGGSLYSMCDPFFMLLLMQKLGDDYVVWDKAAHIDFVKVGVGAVYATFCVDDEEIAAIKALAKDGEAVFRSYSLDITDKHGEVIAQVQKTLYVRKKSFSRSGSFQRRF